MGTRCTSAFLFCRLKYHHINATNKINKNCVAAAHHTPVRYVGYSCCMKVHEA